MKLELDEDEFLALYNKLVMSTQDVEPDGYYLINIKNRLQDHIVKCLSESAKMEKDARVGDLLDRWEQGVRQRLEEKQPPSSTLENSDFGSFNEPETERHKSFKSDRKGGHHKKK